MHFVAAVASGLALWFAFPGFSIEFLAWVALAPLIHAVTDGISLRRAFLLGWITGIVFTFLAENWIAYSMTHFGGFLTVVAYAVALLFAAILAIFPGLFAMLLALTYARLGAWALAGAPAIWVATEWLRPLVTGVTWNALGVSQYEHYSIARLSQFGGAYIISWQIISLSAIVVLLARLKSKNTRSAVAALMMMLVAPFLLSQDRAENVAEVRVAVVQPNISIDGFGSPDRFRQNFEKVLELTRKAIREAPPNAKPELIVWAESPLSLPLDSDAGVREAVEGLAKETGCHIIANTISRSGEDYFNSVNTVAPDPERYKALPLRRYDKIRLVPFGEYVPFRAVLGRFVPTIVGDFSAGHEATVNALRMESTREGVALGDVSEYQIQRETKYVKTGAFICYEAAYPNLIRQFVKNGATLLVNVSDDAWFGNTSGPKQHLAHACMRAIENDRDIVRVTNSGISALVTSEGQILDPLPQFIEGSKVWSARTRNTRTFYSRHGDVFAIVCAALAAVSVGLAIWGRFQLSQHRRDMVD